MIAEKYIKKIDNFDVCLSFKKENINQFILYKKEDKDFENYFSNTIGSDIELFQFKQIKKKEVLEESYFYKGELVTTIPSELMYLLDSFKTSEYILELEDDWDDNGSIMYDIKTWKNSIIFLLNYSKDLLLSFQRKITKPRIYHGPDGSIDILWETQQYSLLINILKGGTNAVFYGGNKDNTQKIKGEFILDNYAKSLMPLAFNI